jgi:outer membrane protein OmpA-like peptidoglycan-associated protein
VTFEDKYDMIIHVEAEDYFTNDEAFNALDDTTNVISKNIALKRSKVEFTLSGSITAETNSIPLSAQMSFSRPGERQAFMTVESDSTNGNYSATIEEQGPFLIQIEADGYLFFSEIYQFPEGQTNDTKNVALIKLQVGVKFVVENILFNSGKATMRSESFDEVDKLANLLKKNYKVRIEVSGHTDNVGSATMNKKLSKERALTVKNFLVSRGVEQDRIEHEGYGFDQPIAPNTTAEGKAKNRRVEVKILN